LAVARQSAPEILRRCRDAVQRGLTIGWAPKTPIKALFFDMDATVIAEESLVELAAFAGQAESVGRITERAMAGEIDFQEALRQRVALIQGLDVNALAEVRRRLTLNPGIRDLVSLAQKRGVPAYMVSGGFMDFAQPIQSLVGFAGIRANRLEIQDGRLTGRLLGSIVDAQGKKDFLLETCRHLEISPNEAAAVGDGANDRPMLEAAGVAVGHRAKPILYPHIQALNGIGDHRFLAPLFFGASC
jgi:phosphoserine phosphatase